MKVLLDCDVLLDVAWGRPDAAASQRVLDWCERNPGRGFVAWHTIANIYYLLRRAPGNNSKARQFISDLLGFIDVVPTGTAECKHALTLAMSDLEDALQAAAAVRVGVDHIVTRNLAHYSKSPISALAPGQFLVPQD